MNNWEKVLIQVGAFVSFIILFAVLGLLFAFPLKWTWNYVMPYLFNFKEITWGQAWCLSWIANTLINARHYNANRKE